jgi:EpsD family peptidyl-prolyl cis-trans isomerase
MIISRAGMDEHMNRSTRASAVLAVALAAGALGACKLELPGSKPKAPTGQVAATVGNQEITVRDLRAEMNSSQISDPKALKQAEEATLRNIVGRTVLAKAAIDQGIDKTPDFAIAKKRLIDGLLVQSLQNKIAAQSPAVTKDEADRYVVSHPDLFSQRKIFSIDYIRMPRPADPAIIKALEPLKTLVQVDAQLTAEKIPHQRATGNLDSVGADPRMVEAILKLPPGELFVLPVGNALLVNQITGTKVVPFEGPQASDYAQKLLTKQRVQEAVNRDFNAIITKAAPTVRFNKDYAPPATAPAPAAVTAPPPAAAQN